MRIAYLDCFSGISGDMFLGALIATEPTLAGVLEKTVSALDIGARLEISQVTRSGIMATKVDVIVAGEKDHARESHQHGHKHQHEHTRGLNEIRQIIGRAPISPSARNSATHIFESLGAAEAKIHGIPIEKVHFHEVGAVDAIVDIVGAAVGAEALHVDEWVCSPLNVGGGTVECAHGRFPVPAPATVELLKDSPVYSSGVEAELVTPTGAAIVSALATRFASFPAMKIVASGYGAGSREVPRHANVLRLTIGETGEATSATEEKISVLEANLDDMSPQVFGYVMDRLLVEGALEVFGTPVQMKKSRPGMVLTVLAEREDASRLTRVLFTETTTLGVRMREEQRQVLPRQFVAVQTPWGEVRMKVASLNGTLANYAPEYEDCRRLAAEHHIPLKTVIQEAVRAYLAHAEIEQHE